MTVRVPADRDSDDFDAPPQRARKPGYEAEVKAREARWKAAGIVDPSRIKAITVAEVEDESESIGRETRTPHGAATGKEPHAGFARVRYTIIDQLGPLMPSSAAWAYVCCIRWSNYVTGVFKMSQKQLGAMMGSKSRSSAKRAMKLLRKAGLIEMVKRGSLEEASVMRVVPSPDMARARAVFQHARGRD